MSRWLRTVRLLLWLVFIAAGVLAPGHASAKEPAGAVLVRLDGAIDPNHAKFLKRAVHAAEERGALFLIMEIDTPGGLGSSMRDMVQTILDSRVPVIAYVSPLGAQAASAGTFVTAAAHVAAMAPGTNIGAATPISGTGEDLPETLSKKATNDAAAFIRSIAETRGRNADKLAETVTQAAAFSAQEAVDLDVVDLTADNLTDLLAKLDGRVLDIKGTQVTLDTDGIRCEKPRVRCQTIHLSFVERFIDVLSDPTITGVLFFLGVLGVIIELVTPGFGAPGILGILGIALGLVAVGNLPVNWAGVGLMLFAIVLIAIEVHVTGFGAFGIGGIISFILGLVFLLEPWAANPPDAGLPAISGDAFKPNLAVIVGLCTGFAAITGLMVVLVWRGKRTSALAGHPTLVGRVGRVTASLAPVGTVQLGGELWSAEEAQGQHVEAGEEVEVTSVDGLTLKVRRKTSAPGGSPGRTPA